VKALGRTSASFIGLRPASGASSKSARMTSAKTNTRCELVLRRELWRRGLRYRLHQAALPGRPDIVFPACRLVVFCDGDFWHGRGLNARLAKLAKGHNAQYWVAKVRQNVERDVRQTRALQNAGWAVLRLWETDILLDPTAIGNGVVAAIDSARFAARKVD
jgi:DNA mismatch endonuclease (patch repair protein)